MKIWKRRPQRFTGNTFTFPCPGVLMIKGGHYACEETVGPHKGMACHNAEAEAIWTEDKNNVG